MGRVYDTLECGCCISCDGGGGLIPCGSENCKAKEHMDEHKYCDVCGDCLLCYDHGDCKYKTDDFVMDVEMAIDSIQDEIDGIKEKINKYMKKKLDK